jgi:hypothetical protein
VYETLFVVMKKENEKGVRRKGTEGTVLKYVASEGIISFIVMIS